MPAVSVSVAPREVGVGEDDDRVLRLGIDGVLREEADRFAAMIDDVPIARVVIVDAEAVTVGAPVGAEHGRFLLDPVAGRE